MKKINFNEVIKEIIILTVAVAIIAAAVYFFLVPSHTSVSSISGLGIVLSNFVPLPLVSDHHDFECGAADHRIFDMRQGIRCENGLYKHYAAGYFSVFLRKYLRIMIP